MNQLGQIAIYATEKRQLPVEEREPAHSTRILHFGHGHHRKGAEHG